ncbi:MAG: hypothetical protein M0R80_03010 [Proteobacteria bacterium]|jgi:hypothetical protein|nr:hypothetical protein [Pseudomonadota bacterium]
MAIKNKDGSIYQLNKPNPLTDGQVWRDMVFYNCYWEGETVPDTTVKLPPKKFELPKIAAKEMEPLSKPEPVQPLPELDKSEIPERVLKNIVSVYCLPAKIETEKDELYDEEREVVKYGEKFSFEAIMVERTDLYIKIWTRKILPTQSIIYPSVFVKGEIKFGDYRWWKVVEMEEKSGGYLVTSTPSELQPDFS